MNPIPHMYRYIYMYFASKFTHLLFGMSHSAFDNWALQNGGSEGSQKLRLSDRLEAFPRRVGEAGFTVYVAGIALQFFHNNEC